MKAIALVSEKRIFTVKIVLMKVYAISGLGADERVFQNLQLNHELIHLKWIDPVEKESIENYAKRLAEKIDSTEEFVLLGLSFGGLIAVEISKMIQPKTTILLSSVELRSELPFVFKLAGRLNIVRWIPQFMFKIPIGLASYLFGTSNKCVLQQIFEDADLKLYKWSVNALVTWKNATQINCTKISGEYDRLLPVTKCAKSVVIKQGHHFMVLDKATEVNAAINDALAPV